ncbi:hypothetical protein [Mangrovimonas sp. TPBH4]|uniref:hypothetical protein n=1 Tax=Mangrovimonas sp. TPBH4 TaxID=1645914 RepID=UPI0006B4A7E3|nr:hypothetical protein [Mangrovimonas sp. TPBH4]
MILGYLDYIIFGFLIFLNILFWKKEIGEGKGCILTIIVGILFGLLLPTISSFFEIQRVKTIVGNPDSTELLYTYFIYPIYWGIGIIQTIVIGIKMSLKNTDKLYKTDSIK